MRFAEDRVLRISDETFNEMGDWIRAAEQTGMNVRYNLDVLARILALTNMGIAQEMSMGPVASRSQMKYNGRKFIGFAPGRGTMVSGPRGTYREGRPTPVPQFSDAAWKIPVRRITGNYFRGWKVKRLVPGVWALVNDSREAYFIEFGINWVGATGSISRKGAKPYLKYNRRVRRPIQKLSLMKTMRFIESTGVADKVWAATFAPFRPGRENSISSRADLVGISQIQSYESGMRFV